MAWVLAGMVGHMGSVTIRSAVISALFAWAGFVRHHDAGQQCVRRAALSADRDRRRPLARRAGADGRGDRLDGGVAACRVARPKCDNAHLVPASKPRRIMAAKQQAERPRVPRGRRSSMSDKIYEVPARVEDRAPMWTTRSTRTMYERSLKDPNGFWAEEAKRLHWYRTPSKIKNVSFGPGNVSIKWFEDGVTNVSYNCIDRHLAEARQPDRDHLGRRRPEGRQEDHLSGAARRGVPDGQHPAQPQRREGRPRHHLHADDPRGRLRDARLRAHRRDPFGGVRRLLAGFARRPHRGLQVERRHHGRRRPARRPQGAAQGQRRRRDRQGRRRRSRDRGASAPAPRSRWIRCATSITTTPPRW